MREFVAITKALASEQRLRILMALRGRSLCESVLIELLGLAAATISKHLWLLRQAGLVDSDKSGRCVCYRLPSCESDEAVGQTLQWLHASLAHKPQIQDDAVRLATLIRRSSVQSQCRQLRRRRARRFVMRTAHPQRVHAP
ncbi:MAG: hypothetical protein ABS95_00450 [Verrucomicrobia bacterium SCN 57-15]|nr:MAG: hypothetical protein ABS95_00450 [Verrucomicrobia bacterium SCN 57-15]